jgi:hypothetical protein
MSLGMNSYAKTIRSFQSATKPNQTNKQTNKMNKLQTLRKQRYELLDDMECVVATADRLQDLAYAVALEHCRRPLFYDTVLSCFVPAPVREW